MEETIQPVVLQGVVIHGRGVGGPSGFPTANLELEPGEHLPKERGVYASFADIDGRRFVGVTNIGTRPTVDSSPVVTVETWFPDYRGDLYGRELRLMDVLESPPLDILEDMEREQNLRHLSDCLERVLSGRELQVICERYGLLGYKERTQREIAKELGISRSYVSRIEKRAVERLREEFQP